MMPPRMLGRARRGWPGRVGSRRAASLMTGIVGVALLSMTACGAQAPGTVSLLQVAGGLSQPVFVLQAPGDDDALYIVEKVGRIRVLRSGRLAAEPLLDISHLVSTRFEQGLLGAAFHPDFPENGWLYVNYTDRSGHTRIVRYTVPPGDGEADPASAKLILSIEQPRSNHNGGAIAFGPDGYLYIATGDGGGAGDPWGNAQNLNTLLGKLLRIDVDGGDPYAVPPDNPFARTPGARGEIWAFGLRNPWRFSFDRETGDIYIADVGQSNWEEVNVQPAASPGGENYGWNRMEGPACYPAGSSCDAGAFRLPVAAYRHGAGGACSITGGYVYRGSAIPSLSGRYLFGDYCSGTVWSIPAGDAAGMQREPAVLLETGLRISSFGEDRQGEIYVVAIDRGAVYKLVQAQGGS